MSESDPPKKPELETEVLLGSGNAPPQRPAPMILANPKGSRYIDRPPAPDEPHLRDEILGNPKGSFYAEARRHRRTYRLRIALAVVLVVGLIGAAVYVLALR